MGVLAYNKPMPTIPAASYKGHRFPAEIMAHAVWLYFRFPLSYRQVEEILAARGIVVSNGQRHYLWRAVDQHRNVLDILVTSRRDTQAAQRFFREILKRWQYVPRVIITDKLTSYGAAKREILPGVEHRQHKGLNNRAENSHQPTRQWERQVRRFKSPGHAQRFLSAFEPIAGHFWLRRHRVPAAQYREERLRQFQSWNAGTGAQLAA